MEFNNRDVIQNSPLITPGQTNVPLGPSPHSNDLLNNAAAPPKTTTKDDIYCNILPGAPRSQIYPPRCGKLEERKRGLSLGYSPDQKVFGIIQDGSENANWVRGNEFGVDYNQRRFDGTGKTKEIDVGALLKNNPMMVADSPFYPKPDQAMKDNKWNLTYPYFKQYSDRGQPVFNQGSLQSPTVFFGGDKIIEGFSGSTGSTCLRNSIFIVLILVIVLFVNKKF